MGVMAFVGAISLIIEPLWALRWIETVRMYPAYVNFMVWLPALTPVVVPIGIALLFVREYYAVLSGLVLILPITGMYHMALYAPIFIKPTRIALLMIAILWAVSFLEPDIKKAVTPFVFIGAALGLEYRFNQHRAEVRHERN